MEHHIAGLKAIIADAAFGTAPVIPAAAVIQSGQVASQVQSGDHLLTMISLSLGVVSSIVALIWNGIQLRQWWRKRKEAKRKHDSPR